MSLRNSRPSHTRVGPSVEVLPPNEQPDPVPPPVAPPSAALNFREDGKIADSATAKVLGAKGGRAKAERVRLISSLGLSKLSETSPLKPYWGAAEEFTAHHLPELARLAGGTVSSGPASMVVSGGLQLAASRYLFDLGAQTGDPALMKQASALANDSRQNLLAAYELAVREAKGRPTHGGALPPWFVQDDEEKKT
jgi:hypothetical protein